MHKYKVPLFKTTVKKKKKQKKKTKILVYPWQYTTLTLNILPRLGRASVEMCILPQSFPIKM